MFSLQPYDANVPSSYTFQGAVPAGSSEQNANLNGAGHFLTLTVGYWCQKVTNH